MAPAGTTAVICVALFTVNVAATPLKVTALAPVKPVPVKVTLAPTRPEVGAKPVNVSTGVVPTTTARVLVGPGLPATSMAQTWKYQIPSLGRALEV